MLSKFLAAASLLAVPAAALAQTAPNGHGAPAEPFIYKSDGDLQGMATKPGVTPVLAMLSDHENYFVEVVGRTASGEPEFHPHYIDYVVVQKGEGTLTYGGTRKGCRG